MKFKKLITISLIFSMIVLRNPIPVFAQEEESVSEELTAENDFAEEKIFETENDNSDTEEETIEMSEGDVMEDEQLDAEHEPCEASISIRGYVPTIVVDAKGYLSEEYCRCYESTFNAYDEMDVNEAISILIDSDNSFSSAEKSALNALNISGICPEDLSLDVYYNQDESEVVKIKATYTLVDEDENETKKNVTLYEKDIR